jgi:hypothetical protein
MGFDGTIILSQNPATNYERFSKTLFSTDTGKHPAFSKMKLSKRAEGGFYRCTFDIHAHREELFALFFGNITRQVEVSTPDGRVCWEGLIYENTLKLGLIDLRLSIKDVYNKVWMRYQITGSGVTSRSSTSSNAASYNRFGNKELVLSGGELDSAAVANQTCDRALKLSRKPSAMIDRVSIGANQQNTPEPYLSIIAVGYIDTLNWQMYNQTAAAGSQSASLEINDIITAKGQFIASTQLSANGTSVSKVYDSDRGAGSIVADIARLGDWEGNRWLVRMGVGRKLYYKQAKPPVYPKAY